MDPAVWNTLSPAQQEAVLDGPALKPPAGTQANFADPPNRDDLVLGVTILCAVLATVFFLLRIMSRMCISIRPRLEDGLAVVAYGTYVGSLWAILYSLSLGGLYVHQWDLTVRTLLRVLYPFWFLPLFYAVTMLLLKTAILLDWMHIFVPKGTRNVFFWTCWPVLVANAVFYVAATFVIAFSCRPVSKFWTPMGEGICINRRNFDFASACINLVLDVIILIIPQRMIWKLQMPLRRKVGISAIFSIGLVACAAALGRIIVGESLVKTQDRTYRSAAPALCSLAEMTCAFLVLCVPAAPKALVKSKSLLNVSELLRSWSRIRTQGRSKENAQQDDWPAPAVYSKMDHGRPVPLRDLEPLDDTRSADLTQSQASVVEERAPHGIVRTTATVVSKDHNPSSVAKKGGLIRQHPWMADDV
ncbi:hypothetical protein PG985_001670 [Apiospora marii]|uniref:uncharacterized protein n=1 Tax=Apiospora marii TaxID=335849 RepID=UPI00312F814D